MDSLNIFCDELLEKAKIKGLEEYEVYAINKESFSVNIAEKEIERYSVDQTTGISFRVKIGDKIGYASTTTLDDESIEMLIDRSSKNAEFIENDEKQFIFEGSETYEEPICYNKDMESVSTEEIINFAKELEQKTLAVDERVKKVSYCTVYSVAGTTIIKNSKGLNLSRKANNVMTVVAPVVEVDGKPNNAYGHKIAFNLKDLNADEIAKESVKEAIDLCSAKEVDSGKYDIIFKNDTFADLFETFENIFSAEAAQKGLSLLAGKEGETIATPILTLTDDPHKEWGFGSSGFDHEGVATYTKSVIENGVFKTLLHNLKTANNAGVKSTGNAAKAGYQAPINISASNWCIKPGEKSFDELVKHMDNGLVITNLAGLHSGANSVSGDFSLSAKGYLVEGGKIVRGVSGITVSGNFYDVMKNITEIGNDVCDGTSTIYTPSVLCTEMSVAGK